MHRATSSSSSAASSSASRSRQRISREQLERSLKVLGRPSDPLPVDLPPSPPASRSSSPAPSFKRRPEYDAEPGPSKRPRTNNMSENRRPVASSHRPGRHSHLRSDPPSEDGELREDLSAPRDIVILSNVPVRRSRRGALKPLASTGYFKGLYEQYYSSARALKYSGTARIHANNRPTSSQYRPLANPPPPHSSYHKYANVMARLELLESLLHFAYSLWAKDINNGAINRANWRSMTPFHTLVRKRWEQDATDDREKALVGLIHMLDGFIQGGKIRENVQKIDHDTLTQLQDLDRREKMRERTLKANAPDHGASSLATPPMLPSPASMTSSANSTPAGKRADESEPQPAEKAAPPPAPPREMLPMLESPVKIEVGWLDVRLRKSLTEAVIHGWTSMRMAQELLSLPILVKHYPRTFARVIHTTLGCNDEHEPDIEDEEGELYWPGQLLVGGVGWVCALGKAMIKEFGKEFGYKGIDGIVLKSDGDAAFPNQVPDPTCAPLPGP